MKKLDFTKARLLTAEFQKEFSRFIMGYRAGRIGGKGQAYLCDCFGLFPMYGLVIEIDLRAINDDDMPTGECVGLPPNEYVGTHGTIPIRYSFV